MPYTITFIFKEKLEPGTPEHLHMVLKNYLAGKGITLRDDGTVEV